MDNIKEKAEYCLNCKMKPCSIKGCPLNNNIPEFIDAIKQQNYRKAYERYAHIAIRPAHGQGHTAPHPDTHLPDHGADNAGARDLGCDAAVLEKSGESFAFCPPRDNHDSAERLSRRYAADPWQAQHGALRQRSYRR